MELNELVNLKQTVFSTIIKIKNKPLYIKLTNCGNIALYEENIYIENDELCIGKEQKITRIKLEELKTIYVSEWYNKGRYNYTLEIVGFNIKNNKTIPISKIPQEDVQKILELLEHFIYSDEINYDKLISMEYKPILLYDNNKFNREFKRYSKEKFKTWDVIEENGNEYILIKILPKKYAKKYKKKYLVYESKYSNSNYIDIYMIKKDIEGIIFINNLITKIYELLLILSIFEIYFGGKFDIELIDIPLQLLGIITFILLIIIMLIFGANF